MHRRGHRCESVAPGKFEVFTHGGRNATGLECIDHARRMVEYGAGEILLTSMDRDGTKSGYDMALTRAVADAVPVPVVASGGVGSLDDLVAGVRDGHASAVLAASIFHFGQASIGQAKEIFPQLDLLCAAIDAGRVSLPEWASANKGTQTAASAERAIMGQQFEFKLGEQALKRLPQGLLPIVLTAVPEGARPQPVKARHAVLPPDVAAEDAFRLTLLQCKWHIASNIAAVVDGHAVEGVHQMRVGFRRLRVALTSFGGDFRTPALEHLKDRAKRLSTKLGHARDLDVFAENLLAPAAEANEGMEGFDLLREPRQRRAPHRMGIRHRPCGKPPASRPSCAIWAMPSTGASGSRRRAARHAASGHMAFEMKAADLAGRMLDHRLKVAHKKAKNSQEALARQAPRAAHRAQEAALHRGVLRAALRRWRRRRIPQASVEDAGRARRLERRRRSRGKPCRVWSCRRIAPSASTPRSPSPPASSMAGTSTAPSTSGKAPKPAGRNSRRPSRSGIPRSSADYFCLRKISIVIPG